jgi:hypothetical protein
MEVASENPDWHGVRVRRSRGGPWDGRRPGPDFACTGSNRLELGVEHKRDPV